MDRKVVFGISFTLTVWFVFGLYFGVSGETNEKLVITVQKWRLFSGDKYCYIINNSGEKFALGILADSSDFGSFEPLGHYRGSPQYILIPYEDTDLKEIKYIKWKLAKHAESSKDSSNMLPVEYLGRNLGFTIENEEYFHMLFVTDENPPRENLNWFQKLLFPTNTMYFSLIDGEGNEVFLETFDYTGYNEAYWRLWECIKSKEE